MLYLLFYDTDIHLPSLRYAHRDRGDTEHVVSTVDIMSEISPFDLSVSNPSLNIVSLPAVL